MNVRQQLRLDQPLTAWWTSVKNDPRFDQICVLARAELSESASGWEQLKGGTAALEMLRTFTDNDPGSMEYPSPGLEHDLSPTPIPKKEIKKDTL